MNDNLHQMRSSGRHLRLRQVFCAALLAVALGGCVSQGQTNVGPMGYAHDPAVIAMYGPKPDEKFPLPATDISQVPPRLLRQEVAYPTREAPGTIIVDVQARYLYLVLGNGRAIRYGIGVGRLGMSWSGRATANRKAEWPGWTPTEAMIDRNPEKNGKWASGMAGGLGNPLGARALYLYKDGRDTMYRIHGTSEPDTIGEAMSSGCVRMFNQDVIDLYSRVPVGAPVLVIKRGGSQAVPQAEAATGGASG